MLDFNRVPLHTLAVLGLTLSVSSLTPRPAAAADPVWGFLTSLISGVAPDEPAGLAQDDPLIDPKISDLDVRRMLDDGAALAQQPVQQPVMVQQPVYAPQYTTAPAPVAGYQTVQNAAVTYWTGQQPMQAVAAQPQPVAAQPQPVASYGDPYGFTAWLNGIRGQYGLAPVSYDENLSAWANMNNAQQNSQGLGHHVMGPARRQNSAMGSSLSIGGQWLASPAHAAALLDPSIRAIGIAGMGAYWTFNAY